MKRKRLMGAVLGVFLGAAAFSVPLWAQWTGEIGGGYVWQNYAGNQDMFITQYGLRQGWVLDNFELAYAPKAGAAQTFGIQASGFGGAQPDQHGSIFFNASGGWRFALNYDRQLSFFAHPVGSFAYQNDQWAVERWKGSVIWDGWSAARLTLNLRYTQRDGYSYRPFFGMSTQYAMKDKYDQTMKEAALRIETKTLPVYISFEQSYAQYERNDSWSPASPYPLFGRTNNWLAGLETPRKDETDVPTSRLIMAYRNDVVDVAGSFLYAKADMDSTGTRTAAFDLQAGTVGQAQYIDSLIGSASQDTRAANVDLAIKLGAGWSLMLAGDYRNATQDANLFGTNAIKMGRPGDWVTISQQVVDNSFFDVKDGSGRIEIMKKGNGWSAWGGYQALSREVSYGNSYVDPNVKRTGDGWFLGGSWSRTPALHVDAEYQHGTFEHYVFRTDPDLAQSFTFHLNSRLGGGWQLGARARWEQTTNPSDISGLYRQSESAGLTAAWGNSAGTAGFGFTADTLQIKARTNTYLPLHNLVRVPWISVYNVDVLAIGANGHFKVGRVYFDADLAYLRNSGDNQPMTTWNGGLKAAVDVFKGGQVILFGQYRSYVEDWDAFSLNNYYVRRYGVSLRWRF